MDNVLPIRAYVVVNSVTRERVSHEMPDEETAWQFIQQIAHAEGDGFEVMPIS